MKAPPQSPNGARRKPLSSADLLQIHWASGANILFGAWLFLAPWLLDYAQDVIRWNDTITGAVLIVLATLRYIHPLHRFWISWTNALIGLWMIAAPFACIASASPRRSTTRLWASQSLSPVQLAAASARSTDEPMERSQAILN